MVVEATAEVRNDDIGRLFSGLNLSIVAGLDVFQVIVDGPIEVALVVDGVLVDPAREADVGVGVDENFEIDECGQVLGDFIAHEDVGAFDDQQFCGFDANLHVLPVALVVDLDFVADEQREGLLVEEVPVGARTGVLVAFGRIDEVGLVQDGNGFAALADGPLALLVLEHVVDHLLLARAVAPADAHNEGPAVVVDEVHVNLLELAQVEGFLIGFD